MCEANVYLLTENDECQLLLESVDKLLPTETGIYLENIFGERKTVHAAIHKMELVHHRIILKTLD